MRKAIVTTGKLFVKEGCTVKVITWNYPDKGVDDLIAARGVEIFEEAYNKRKYLAQFSILHLLNLTPLVDQFICSRFLPTELEPPESAGLIGLSSAKGTGKTHWLVNIVSRAIADGIRVLVITHRIQLAKALCYRFGIDHIEEVRDSDTGGILGYGLCIDSLHENSQARFDPEDWEEALVILDEAEQVIWHMLNSETCLKQRVSILENFEKLLKIVVNSGG